MSKNQSPLFNRIVKVSSLLLALWLLCGALAAACLHHGHATIDSRYAFRCIFAPTDAASPMDLSSNQPIVAEQRK